MAARSDSPPDAATALFGHRIRELRKDAGLTIEEAAEVVDISANYLGQLERGRKTPSFDMIVRLANAYHVGPVRFFKEDEPPTDTEYRVLISATLQKCSPEQLRAIYRMLVAVLARDA